MTKQNNDQCCTVRLPHGIRDELVAATGQPFSRIVRYMCMHLIAQKRAERQLPNPKRALQQEIANLPQPTEEGLNATDNA